LIVSEQQLNVLVDNVLVAAFFTQEVTIRTIDVKKVFFYIFFNSCHVLTFFTSFAEDERFLLRFKRFQLFRVCKRFKV